MARDMDVEEDGASVASANAGEQLSFWSLTLSFMLKLVAMGVTLFVLPYNEWITLRDATAYNNDESAEERVFLRGVSGSDCVRDADAAIDCARWRETRDGQHDDFWSLRMIVPDNVEHPSAAYRLIFYALLGQLVVYVLDMGATLAMCCRYRVAQKLLEKRVAALCYLTLVVTYLYVILVAVASRHDFLHNDPPFKACLGTAFRLYAVVAAIYQLASLLIFYTEFYRPAADGSSSSSSSSGNATLSASARVRLQLLDLLPRSAGPAGAKYARASTNAELAPTF